jgi:hypothetical protein
MAQPIWQTPSGSLGEIDERISYSNQLSVTDADDDSLTFSLHAGSLPSGLNLSKTGLISGTPSEVAERTEKEFVVRVTDGTYSVDRSFKLFVEGSDAPTWTTPAGSIGIINDGEYLDFQLVANDNDSDIKFYKIVAGGLPKNVTLNTLTGKLSGVILPVPQVAYDSTALGFDAVAFDESQPWDLVVRSGSIDRLYEFTVRVSDGISHSDRKFSLDVRGLSQVKADTLLISCDDSTITADASDVRSLYFITPAGNLANIKHDNYHIIKLQVVDPDAALGLDGDSSLSYKVTSGSLPTGLTLDTQTGTIYGYVPRFTQAVTAYTFTVEVTKSSAFFVDQKVSRSFQIDILGELYKAVQWTPVEKELVI